MRTFPLFLCLSGLLLLANCGGDQIQLPNKELEGLIGGEEWNYKFANAYRVGSGLKHQIKFLSVEEGAEDPCAVPSTGNRHLSIIMQLSPGSYSLPLPILDESARFHITQSNAPIATSGFLEIFDISNSRVFGYMQAQLDDDNEIEGSFEAFICN